MAISPALHITFSFIFTFTSVSSCWSRNPKKNHCLYPSLSSGRGPGVRHVHDQPGGPSDAEPVDLRAPGDQPHPGPGPHPVPPGEQPRPAPEHTGSRPQTAHRTRTRSMGPRRRRRRRRRRCQTTPTGSGCYSRGGASA